MRHANGQTNVTQQSQTAKIREDVAEEDLLRADLYAMLAQVLAKAPSKEFLSNAAGLTGDGSDLGEGIAALA